MTFLSLAPLFALVPLAVSSSEGPPPILQPATYRSPDGHYTLDVDPSRRDGGGAGTYTVRKDGKVTWSGAKPWTMWEGLVTDAGFVAGYAYTEGFRDHRATGEFHAVILSPTGDVLADAKTKRTSSRMMHSAPDPLGTFVLHVPKADRVFVGVRVAGDAMTPPLEMWCFQLPDGKELFRKRPLESLEEDEHSRFLQAARVVPGTSLILTQWARLEFGQGASRYGARYALFDADLAKQWELVRPTDCNSKDDKEQDRFWDLACSGKLLLDGNEPERFAIWAPASGERLNFRVSTQAVARNGTSDTKPEWTVSELGKEPYVEPKAPAPAESPSISLAAIEVHDLEASDAGDSPLGEIAEFAPETATTFRVVRRAREPGHFALVHVDLSCKVTSEHAVVLDGVDPELRPQWYPVTDHSWIVTQSPYGEGAKATAWNVDDRTGVVVRLESFDAPFVQDVAGFGDGRFVVLAQEKGKYTMQDVVIACDAKGARLWTLEQDYASKGEGALFSPEAVAVTGTGRVCVLDNIKKSLQFFDASGKFQQFVDLEKAFGQEPNYPSGLEWDSDGGVLVDDFDGQPRLWRLDAGGVVRSKMSPRLADGRVIEALPRRARIAPDGRMWSTDGGRLYRLDAQGVVDLEIGAKLSADVLGKPSAIAIDLLGRALIQDEDTGAVHVFDERGKRLFVCKPEPADFGTVSSIAHLAALPDGGVLVENGSGFQASSYLTFDAQGRRTAMRKDLPDNLSVSPTSGARAGTRYGGHLVFVDDAWKVRKDVERKPDRRWLVSPEGPAMGPDGTIAVVDGPEFMSRNEEPPVIALYSKDGEPIRVVPILADVHAYRVALGRDWAVLSSYGPECRLVKLDDGSVKRFVLPASDAKNQRIGFGFSPDGTELRVLDATSRKLHRFALP